MCKETVIPPDNEILFRERKRERDEGRKGGRAGGLKLTTTQMNLKNILNERSLVQKNAYYLTQFR